MLIRWLLLRLHCSCSAGLAIFLAALAKEQRSQRIARCARKGAAHAALLGGARNLKNNKGIDGFDKVKMIL
jgi:hypothetical protein